MYEIDVTKWHGGILIDIETREKVVKKFGKPGMSISAAMATALESSVKKVKLTKAELDKIRDEIDENYRKRMERREARKQGKK